MSSTLSVNLPPIPNNIESDTRFLYSLFLNATVANKFNTVTNQLMYELFRYKGIVVKDTINVKENEEYILSEEYSDFYQLKIMV